MNTVWMSHPNLPGQEIEVPESAAPVHAHSGWVAMENPPERLAELPEVASLRALETADPDPPADTQSGPDNDRSGNVPNDTSEPTGAKRTRHAPRKDDH